MSWYIIVGLGGLIAVVVGLLMSLLGFFNIPGLNRRTTKGGDKKVGQQIAQLLADGRAEAKEIIARAKTEASNLDRDLAQTKREIEVAREEADKHRLETESTTKQLVERSTNLDSRATTLEKRLDEVRQQETDLGEIRQAVADLRDKQIAKLEKIAKLTQEEAAEKLTAMVENNLEADLSALIAKRQIQTKADAEGQATAILVATMERLASDVTADRTVTAVKIDNEKIKGRIIGKDGRNISAFQRATGVDVMTDDAPNTIVLSSFDPIRREVARRTLEMLIEDGRIHPGRIENLVDKAQKKVQKEVVKAADEAAREVGISGIPPEISQLLGELKFRTSYGQNVLKHSVEMSHLAGVLAAQLGANVRICKYAALVHDLGKALTHKIEGKHHHLSGEMLRKYGVEEAVAHAAEAHHDDVEATTTEAMVIRAVDAISASRPGARNNNTDNYIKRMKDLENIATSFDGVEKAYAIDGGREVRVFIDAQHLNDLQSYQVARDIATKIESQMSYPGQVKVVAIRETRAVEYAK